VSDVVLPELVDIETPDGHLVVRWFPSAAALEFPRLPQAARRSIPSVVRRLFKAAAEQAGEASDCLICGAAAPAKGRVLIAVETDGNYAIGCVCSDCAAWGLGGPPLNLSAFCDLDDE
jgi:hypothetical protein